MGENRNPTVAAAQSRDGWSLKAKLILVGVVLAVAVGAYLFAVSVIPRWWAQRIGGAVDGRLTFGAFLGVVIGVFFTMLPLFVLALAWRFRGDWKRWLLWLAVAALAASPNLATLGIMFGNGSAAHAGERILDVDGPGYRGGTMVGILIGALLMAGLRWLFWSRRRHKRNAEPAS